MGRVAPTPLAAIALLTPALTAPPQPLIGFDRASGDQPTATFHDERIAACEDVRLAPGVHGVAGYSGGWAVRVRRCT
jgi:hypothetical protein